MEKDERTLAFYAAEAPAYAKAGDQKASAHLPEFLARLGPGTKIDITNTEGCGYDQKITPWHCVWATG